jgi:hypothetical protein
LVWIKDLPPDKKRVKFGHLGAEDVIVLFAVLVEALSQGTTAAAKSQDLSQITKTEEVLQRKDCRLKTHTTNCHHACHRFSLTPLD